MYKVIALTFLVIKASAQTLNVCDVLRSLEDLNGQEITVRGNWSIGHLGQELRSKSPCKPPTVRDGWIWSDAIFLFPQDQKAKEQSVLFHQILKPYGQDLGVRVMATLVGRLETRNHFEVESLPTRRQPRSPFGYFVAVLRYRVAADLDVVRYTPEQLEWDLRWRKEPWAKPVEDHGKR